MEDVAAGTLNLQMERVACGANRKQSQVRGQLPGSTFEFFNHLENGTIESMRAVFCSNGTCFGAGTE